MQPSMSRFHLAQSTQPCASQHILVPHTALRPLSRAALCHTALRLAVHAASLYPCSSPPHPVSSHNHPPPHRPLHQTLHPTLTTLCHSAHPSNTALRPATMPHSLTNAPLCTPPEQCLCLSAPCYIYYQQERSPNPSIHSTPFTPNQCNTICLHPPGTIDTALRCAAHMVYWSAHTALPVRPRCTLPLSTVPFSTCCLPPPPPHPNQPRTAPPPPHLHPPFTPNSANPANDTLVYTL
jgi:hypothetical protein